MKSSIKRDVLIYSISFVAIILLGIILKSQIFFTEINRIFHYLGMQMIWLKRYSEAVSTYQSLLYTVVYLILFATTIILPITFIIRDSKKNERFRPINILWILFVIASAVYYISFLIEKINLEVAKSLLSNDLLLIGALSIFIIDAAIRIKEDWKNAYNLANIFIKVYLFFFMMIKASDIIFIFTSNISVLNVSSLIINFFINTCYFLMLYTVTLFIDSQKENVTLLSKILHIRHIKIYSAIILIVTSVSAGLTILLSIIINKSSGLESLFLTLYQHHIWISIALFIFSVIMLKILEARRKFENENMKQNSIGQRQGAYNGSHYILNGNYGKRG